LHVGPARPLARQACTSELRIDVVVVRGVVDVHVEVHVEVHVKDHVDGATRRVWSERRM
jgi:hypothetical protein